MFILIFALFCIITPLIANDHDAFDISKEIILGNSSRINPNLQFKKRNRTISTSTIDYESPAPKRAIIIGASVGMGKELAKMLAADGYIVGMTSRRLELLQELQQQIPSQNYIAQMDVSQPDESTKILEMMIDKMGGLDLIVIAATGFWDCDFDDNDWKKSLSVLTVDVVGFFALARTALNYFEEQGYGHLVGFSSIDGLHGVASCQAYSASKAFCSRYLEAERNKFMQKNIPIYVTELCPGWINSRGNLDFADTPHAYWVESLDDAMHDIMEAIKNKEDVAYITRRWQKVAELLKNIPSDLYNALSARPGGGF
jgi:short-subunit dehydrogenase